MAVKVYVISDPLAINFLVNDDIDGFKEYLDSDDMLDFSEPEENAYLERGKTRRHGYASFYRGEDGNVYFKLNLQIRLK